MANNQDELQKEVISHLPAIIEQGDAEVLVKQAQSLGHKLGDRRSPYNLTTTQLRAVFGTLRKIEMNWQKSNDRGPAQRSLIMLKPKMVYRANRESGSKGTGMQAISGIFGEAINSVVAAQKDETARERFTHLVEFFEATLAYHREAGGR
jgi:CRISPR-associated protein Csm2